MIRATLKSLLSRKVRLILSGLAVVLAMCFYTGADVMASSMATSFERLFTQVYDDIDAQVLGPVTVVDPAHPGIGPRANLPESVLEQVRSTPGVASAQGQVMTEGVRVIGHDGKVIPSPGAPRYGAAWYDGGGQTLRAGGRAPRADDEVVLNGQLAKLGGFTVGETIQILTLKPAQPFHVVGIYELSGGRGSIAGEQVVAFTKTAAQQLMIGQTGVYTSIDIRAADGVPPAQLRERLTPVLTGKGEVKTHDELVADSTKSVGSLLDVMRTGLHWFANIALFVGMFLILNTFSMLVTQRLRELALYRAMGASRRQILMVVLTEAALVGVIASLLGVAFGVGAGIGLKALLQQLVGTQLPDAGITLQAATVIQAVIYGTAATVLAAIVPALRASRVPPVAALRDAETPDRPLTKVTIAGLVLLIPGIALLAYALTGNAGDNTMALLAAGAGTSFVGIALLTPLISRPVVRLLGSLLSWNLPGRLGRANSARNPRRTALTASALMIGIALITGSSLVSESLKQTFIKKFDDGVNAQLVISGEQNSELPPTFSTETAGKVANLSGVGTVATLATDAIAVDGTRTFASAGDLGKLVKVLDVKFRDGSPTDLRPGQILLDDGTAKKLHKKTGDTVQLRFAKGQPKTATVAGVLTDDMAMMIPGNLLPTGDTGQFQNPNPNTAYVSLAAGADLKHVKNDVAGLLVSEPEVTVRDQDAVAKQRAAGLDQLMLIMWIMLALAIVIAVLGVINTLALSVIERIRELGLLRAVGMKRTQLRWMITVESVIIAVFGAALGMAVGTALGVAIIRALQDEGVTELALPWGQMVGLLVAAVIAGLLAAILPAFRASRLNVLSAIAHD